MKIGHCQFETRTGDFDGNLAKVINGVERAQREGVEVVCFPECFLTGYPDHEDLARKHAFSVDSPQVLKVLDRTSRFEPTLIVGFNERRGHDLYNTALVARKGHVLGTYSKCFAYQPFHKQGREFPVFEHKALKFGIVICADGGYVEPARILALKGARVIFSPHFNYIRPRDLLAHFRHVRSDHVARAVENCVYFVRGNNVVLGKDESIRYEGVGYGDSYIVDPYGEIVVRSRRQQEDFIAADIDLSIKDANWRIGRSLYSLRELGKQLMEAAAGRK
ncbi:MAG TPA: carbon-nitrogen hydrolase family protein [Gemmataceae bacterium]|nr:carbon-nitrogen hydrolase family protein [Gemmataceae bacterium]